MLFPAEKYQHGIIRDWFLVPHDELFDWVKGRHSHTPKWDDAWSYPYLNKALKGFLLGCEFRSIKSTSTT
jgi:hypothetical protein